MKAILFIFATVLVFAIPGFAQLKNTENTLKLSEGRSREKASIADAAFLTGSWQGPGLGGMSDETWSRPEGGAIVGTYRLVKDGKPVFYEMMWILEVEGTLILRLKHFNPDLTGWEEKDKTVDFKFIKKDGKRLYFAGLTYEHASEDELNIYLALRQRDGTLKEEVFRMKRLSF